MQPKIIFVDDEPSIIDAFRRQLRGELEFDSANSGQVALDTILRQGPYAVVISDMRMPGMDGVNFLARVKERAPDAVRMMLTGNNDIATATRAVNTGGIFRFLIKPCSKEDLLCAVRDAFAQHRLICAEKELLHNTLHGAIKTLSDILAIVDPVGFGRALGIRRQAKAIAAKCHFTGALDLELAAMLCDLGTVVVPGTLTKKINSGATLTREEEMVVARLPEVGSNLLRNIPRMESVAEMVRCQAVNFDGSGNPPPRMSGESIPFGARVLHVLRDLAIFDQQDCNFSDGIKKLQARRGVYDPEILAIAGELFGEGSDAGDESGSCSFEVSVDDLCPGQILISDVATFDGLTIIAAGQELTETSIERVRNYARLVGLKEPILIDRRE